MTTRKTLIPKPKAIWINVPGGPYATMKKTLAMIGEAIVEGSRYLPIRNRAAKAAARANRKDYLGQLREVYNDFLSRWRYVRDPFGQELVAISPEQVYDLVMGGDSGIGAGDCDDAAIAMGALSASIGFPVKIVTTETPFADPGPSWSHVFIQAWVPGHGWVTADPVLEPEKKFGDIAAHSRIASWDLTGRLLNWKGNAKGLHGIPCKTKGKKMLKTNIETWTDYANPMQGDCLGEYDPITDLDDFRVYGVKNWGMYADSMGLLGGMGLMAEVDTDENGLSWAPQLEIAPWDYSYMTIVKRPYHGMRALGDNLETYEYDSNLGFFKKIFKKVKKGIKKGVRKVKAGIKKGVKAVLKKVPGGKYVLKLGKKIWKIATKLVAPLMKIIGPIAKKLAPVAALIPGYGPAVAAAMYKAGDIYDAMKKAGAVVKTVKGKPELIFSKAGGIATLKKELEAKAKSMAQNKQRVRALIAKGKAPARAKSAVKRAA